MAYEIFTRKVQRAGSPVLSFSKIGQIVFNQSASEALRKAAIEHVFLMWDAQERKMAVKSTTNKKDPRAYRIRFFSQANGAGTSAKTFMDYIGLDSSERRSVPIEINPNSELLIEVKLPDEFFKKKPQPRVVGERGRVAG